MPQRYLVSDRYLHALGRLEGTVQQRVFEALEKFEREPGLPGLNLEKLKGHENLWSIRVTRGFRILLSKTNAAEGPQWILADVGPHDVYRRAGR